MAQNVTVAGASYADVPSVLLPKTGGGTASFVDTSNATATASGDVVLGKTAYGSAGTLLTGSSAPTLTGTYTANTKTLAITTSGTTGSWFGGLNFEFLGDYQWSAKLNQAQNWPLTPTDKAQNLTWKTSITTTANANATYARCGKGYDGVTTALDFGTYNYILLIDSMVHLVFTSDEASLGKWHVIANAAESIHHWGARPRMSSGALIYPTTSTYGTYASVAAQVNMCYYRNDSNVLLLTNNSTYGVSIANVAPSLSSTSSVKPNYLNIRIPTFGVRYNASYMTLDAFSDLDASKTTLSCRTRVYRVPVEFGLYAIQNERLLDSMILGNAFPAEPL